jgi:hypothetical protein
MAIWCNMVLLGQVMTRMNLDWIGSPIGNRTGTWSPFKIMVTVTAVYFFGTSFFVILFDGNNSISVLLTTLRLVFTSAVRACGEDSHARIHSPQVRGPSKRLFRLRMLWLRLGLRRLLRKLSVLLPYHCADGSAHS